jgi:hypothetical protein
MARKTPLLSVTFTRSPFSKSETSELMAPEKIQGCLRFMESIFLVYTWSVFKIFGFKRCKNNNSMWIVFDKKEI